MKALLLLFVCIIPIIQVVEAEHGWVDKGIKCTTFLLRWATCAPCAVYESAYTTHLKQFVLLRVGHVLVHSE